MARLAPAAAALLLSGCAALATHDPIVDVVGVEPAAGAGAEARFVLTLRVLNPGDAPLEYDGVFVELDVRGSRLAAGVSDARGTVPRYGEATLAVPVTVPVTAMIGQALGLVRGGAPRFDYRLRGRLGGPGLGGGTTFRSQGELALPARSGPPR